MNHTPGPWAVSPTKHRTLIVSALGFQVAAADDVSAADAKLIAAAPTMLEALREALAFFDGEPVARYAVENVIRSAIAKATGAA